MRREARDALSETYEQEDQFRDRLMVLLVLTTVLIIGGGLMALTS